MSLRYRNQPGLHTAYLANLLRGTNVTDDASYNRTASNIAEISKGSPTLMANLFADETGINNENEFINPEDDYVFIAHPGCCPECTRMNGMSVGMNPIPLSYVSHPNCLCRIGKRSELE